MLAALAAAFGSPAEADGMVASVFFIVEILQLLYLAVDAVYIMLAVAGNAVDG